MKKVGNYKDMNPYYRVAKLFHKGIRPYAHPDEYFLVEVDKDNADLRYKYKRFEKGADRHLYDKAPIQIKYIIGNKFILEGDEVNLEREPDEKGEERKVWLQQCFMCQKTGNLMESRKERLCM